VSSRARHEAALNAIAPAVVAACVLTAAAGSSIQRDVFAFGRPSRWMLIVVLLAYGLARAAVCGRAWRFRPAVAVAILAFCVLSFVSTAWSVNAHGTFERAVGQAAVIAAVGALVGCVPSRPELASRLLDGVLAAAVIVSLAGFVYWLLEPARAANQTVVDVWRYRGIEQNPNTAALLLAIAAPLALSRTFRARSAVGRVLLGIVTIGLVASIVASGSRNGLMAGFFGLLVLVALAPFERRRRIVLGVAVVGALALAVWLITIPRPLSSSSATAPPPTSVPPRAQGVNAEAVLPLSAEIGSPWWTHAPGYRRTVFTADVRVRAWRGTVEQALGRPFLGYGFGAEQWAFINRYYTFNSQNPENGYLGLLLQLGVTGLLLFLMVLVLCIVPTVRVSLRRPEPVAAAAVAAAAAAGALGIGQSFFHGPGSISYVAFWVSLLVAAALAVPRGMRPSAVGE
jgi:hypothetical protein